MRRQMLLFHTYKVSIFFIDKLTPHLVYLIYSEELVVAESTKLSLGPQQFGLDFWRHVGQQVTQISRRRHGELWH